jgi:uncharacterized membrane protein YebE (DUF533 family)
MDLKALLDQLVQAGKEMADKGIQSSKDMAEKGKAAAEETLDIPKDEAGRASMASQVGTGAAVAGVLALLLGTNAGRRVGGATLKLGSLAALGGLAYQMYRQWEGQVPADQAPPSPQSPSAPPSVLSAPEEPQASPEVLLKAMVAAAKADGHIDAKELETIRQQLANANLNGNVNDLLMAELVRPVSAKEVAALANGNKAVASEIYVASLLYLNEDNEAEKAYLKDLQAALGLPDEVVAGLKATLASAV